VLTLFPYLNKINNMKIRTISYLSLLLFFTFALTSIGCKKDDNNNNNSNTYNLSGNATGDQEVPVVTTNGTGTVSGTYDANTNTLQYSVTWSNLSGPATAAHFHGPALPGQNATVVVPFTIASNGTSATGSTTLTEEQEADLLAGKWYFNVHTDAHKGGEIRGQVTAKK
jgi:hypothetical protein